MRKITMILVALIAVTMSTMSFAQSSGYQKLDEWTEVWKNGQQTYFGYPANQQSPAATCLSLPIGTWSAIRRCA